MTIEWPPTITLEEALPILANTSQFNPQKFGAEQQWFIRHCIDRLQLSQSVFALTMAGAVMFYSVVSELAKQAELEKKTH